nr:MULTISPECIES: transporter substrate-binding domain-containing protein [unclassified Lentimicrobium]
MSAEEKEWLKHNHSIIVAPEKNFPPFAFIDDKGFFKGISADFLAEIEEQLGLNFIIAPPFHLSKNLELIRQEEIDIITSIKSTKERREYMDFSIPYIEIPTIIITRKIDKKHLNLNDLEGCNVGVGENYAVHEFLRTNYPDLSIQTQKDDLDGLKKLSLGQLDAVIMDLASASFLTDKNGITNLFVSGEVDFTYDLCMASVKSKPIINQLLNKAIQNISLDRKMQIKEKWIHLNGPNPEYRYNVIVVFLVIVLLLFGLAILFLNYFLKRKIREKTLELQLQVKDNKVLEEELICSLGKQKEWYVNSPLPYQSLTVEGRIDEVNSEWLKSLGYQREEVIGKWFGDFLDEESKEGFRNNFSSIFERKYVKNAYLKIRHRNGRFIDILLNGKVSKDPIDGKFKTYCVFQNVSRQVKNDTELKKFKEAIEQSPVCVVMTDPKGNIEFANKQFELLTGYSFREALGRNPRILNAGTQRKEYYKNMWDIISSGNTWTGEFHNRKKNGELFWEMAVISPIQDKNGLISNYIAVKEDVTERKKLWRELVVAKEKAMESDKIKSAFLANMSHELRTPLNAIIGFSDLIDHDLSKEEILSYMNIINNSGKELQKIVTNIFDISLLQTDEIKVNLADVDLQRLFTNVYDKAIGEQSLEKLNQITLKTEFSSDCDGRKIHTDSYLLGEVILHMVHNAFKFTIKGEIKLMCKLLIEDGIEFVKFSILDTGIGISEENQSLIFKSFKKVNHSTGELYSGVGIGLSISKRLVEILGGDIKVKSVLGKGSEFSFKLPL